MYAHTSHQIQNSHQIPYICPCWGNFAGPAVADGRFDLLAGSVTSCGSYERVTGVDVLNETITTRKLFDVIAGKT